MAGEVQVLLVDEEKGRNELRRLLGGHALTLHGESGFGAEAVTVAQETQPDVVILGMAEPIARPLRTIELLSAAFPQVGIVVVSSDAERDTMRKAMRAGARDYLQKPVGSEDLARAVLAVYEAQQKKQNLTATSETGVLHTGELFVVFGAKGGIGKTTLAVNLAAAIASETKQRVALVDLDVQLGDVALMLGMLPEHTIVDAALNSSRLEPDYLQGLLQADRSGVRVLPAPTSPEASNEVTAEQIGHVLDALVRTFDYVVVDTAPTIDQVNIAALERATLTMLISTSDLPALKRTKIALGLLLKEWNFPEERIKLVMNYPYSHNGAMLSDVEVTLDHPIFWKIPYDSAVAQSIKAGRPCVEMKQNARFSRNIVDLARSVCGVTQRSAGIFGLFRH